MRPEHHTLGLRASRRETLAPSFSSSDDAPLAECAQAWSYDIADGPRSVYDR